MRAHRHAQEALPFSYTDVGATKDRRTPNGFAAMGAEVPLGSGAAAFERGKAALRAWKHFDLGWVWAMPGPVEVGSTITVRSSQAGFHTLLACRVVWIVDEPRRFAFAYGTLPGHVEMGEERFEIVWAGDDTVRYEVASFSRVRARWLRPATLFARVFQRRFLRDSCAAMARAAAEP